MLDYLGRRDPRLPEDASEELWHLLAAVLSEKELDSLRQSVNVLLLRVLEMALIADPALIEIARFPDVYAGRSAELIADRLSTFFETEEIPAETVAHLRSCLLSRASLVTDKQTVKRADLVDTFRAARSAATDNALRCALCGYHFREVDLGMDRLELAQSLDFAFAPSILARRLRDHWKRATERNTRLAVDHVVPEAGFGWTAADNLQLTCEFCNFGKQIFRWGGERLSAGNAASLAVLVAGERMQWAVRGACFSTVAGGTGCARCNRGVREVELTARHRTGTQEVSSIAPWLLEPACYDCFDPGADA